MRWLVLLGAFLLGGAAPAEFPLQHLLHDAKAAQAFDYPTLRDQDARSPQALLTAARSAIKQRRGGGEYGCRTTAEVWVEQGLTAASRGDDSESWRRDRMAAEKLMMRFQTLRQTVLDGGQTGDVEMDGEMAVIQHDVAVAPTPRAKALELRVLSDQFNRRFGMDLQKEFTRTLPSTAHELFNALLLSNFCNDDHANLEWVKNQIEQNGWFSISRDGATADQDAWLLVQHADDDIAYQEKILSLLTDLRAHGDTSAKNYAYLYDRVAVNRQRPQRYGTQGGCKNGERFTAPLEDPTKVDALRAEVGLKPLAEYNALFRCRKPTG